ncbi:MAG: sigma-54 interaction domain-containing protein [Bilophila wadsworthia]
MEEHIERNKRVLEQWERFHRQEPVDESAVRPLILRSWEALPPSGGQADNFSKVSSAPPRWKSCSIERDLVAVAKSIREKLYNPISTSRSLPCPTRRDRPARALGHRQLPYPAPRAGQPVAESAWGPMPSGRASWNIRPWRRWLEHYRRCSTADLLGGPIRDSRNAIVGVLNVTLPSALYHHHTRGMMEAAAHAIAEQLRLRLLLQEQKAIIEMLDEGVVVLEGDGTIRTLNNKAQAMLDLPPDAVHGNIQDIIFSSDIIRAILGKRPIQRSGSVLQLKGGSLNCMLSLTRLNRGKAGWDPARDQRIKESAVRVTGAKAVYTFDHIVGNAPATQEVVRMARMAAQSDVTTLILGESGTGKELFAQSIHNGGRRANAPFVVVNCGALPRNLVQSELFGYDEGSFTGASRLGKPGKFELADNGTIFLDEIGEMPLEAQVSLLRLLQNGEVTRVGGKHTRLVNVRVLAATNRNLENAIRQNAFREDLYYRLNVFTLNVPPLRERSSDIALLINHFLDHFVASLGRGPLRVTDRAMDVLLGYPWPGKSVSLKTS